MELSAALAGLDEMLRTEAIGSSLTSLYDKIPPILRGYVELVYDLNNNASFRLLESLLYRSKYYVQSAQSFRLALINGDDRPFVLSTPRLDSQSSLHLNIPFNSPLVDNLFELKTSPRPWKHIRDQFGNLPPDSELQLLSFLDSNAPSQYSPYAGTGIRWRYFGHACILVETSTTTFLFDPVLSYTYESGISRYTYEDLPTRIDYAVITHNHQDHILARDSITIKAKDRSYHCPAFVRRSLTGSIGQTHSSEYRLRTCHRIGRLGINRVCGRHDHVLTFFLVSTVI